MSRIGNMPVKVPSGVSAEMNDGTLLVRGPKGELTLKPSKNVNVKVDGEIITVSRKSDELKAKAEHGLTRSLINNMIVGASEGFKKQLEVEGVGFKTSASGQNLKLSLGYSHDIDFSVPREVSVSVEDNVITLESADKQLVGQVAAEIRKLRKPEPYKGKGIRYTDEYIIRKAGKAAAGGEE